MRELNRDHSLHRFLGLMFTTLCLVCFLLSWA